MRTRVLTAFLVFMIVALYSASANAEKLCIKTSVNRKSLKATTVSAIASVCPAGYTAIADRTFFTGPKGEVGVTGAAGGQGPQGIQGPAGAKGDTGAIGAQGPQGPAGVVRSLYDSNDQLVAPVVNLGCQQFFSDNQRMPFERATALLTVDSLTFPVCASLDGFIVNHEVAFASAGCTGQAYLFPIHVPLSSSTIFAAGVVTAAGSQRILYRPDYITGSGAATRRSYFNIDGVCVDATSTETLFTAIQVLNLTSAYTAPFDAR